MRIECNETNKIKTRKIKQDICAALEFPELFFYSSFDLPSDYEWKDRRTDNRTEEMKNLKK